MLSIQVINMGYLLLIVEEKAASPSGSASQLFEGSLIRRLDEVL